MVAAICVAVMCVQAAQAGEPAQQGAQSPDVSWIQQLTVVVLFFTSGVGIALVKAINGMRNAALREVERIADERIAANEKAEDAAREGRMPQPFTIEKANPPVGTAEFKQYRERNTAAHAEMFDKLRAVEEKLRHEMKEEQEKLLARMDAGFAELRAADTDNANHVSSAILKLSENIATLRGAMERKPR